jgi:hypothetical protein
MAKIFISYSLADKQFAQQLVEHLKQHEVSGWLDAADISAGSAIASEVRTAIRDSAAIAVIVSPESVRSRWVDFEVGAGIALGIPIIPIVVEGKDIETDLPEQLRGLNLVDARNRPVEEVAQELEDSIC